MSIITAAKAYLAQVGKWHAEYFSELMQRRSAARQRRRDGLPLFPEPHEVLNAPYVFVLSTGRCGTSLLTRILRSSPQLLVYHSPTPELEYVSSTVHSHEPSLEALELAILAARFELFTRVLRRGRTYVETNNRITLFAPALARMLPQSKFIHLVRCPAAFVRSGMRRNYYRADNIQHQRLRPLGHDAWQEMDALEKIAWEWNEINAAVERFKVNLDPKRLLTMRSEELFSEPESIFDLFRFLAIESPFSVADSASLKARFLHTPVNAQVKGDFPKYEDWTDSDKQALRSVATLAPRYGYDL